MRIALAGNPNSGKTTMYNALTGRNEKIGNWGGVTKEYNAELCETLGVTVPSENMVIFPLDSLERIER